MTRLTFKRRLRESVHSLAWLPLAMGLTTCAQPGFECGREVPGKPGTFRRCDRSNEVCVCYTNSCAKAVPKADPYSKPKLQSDAGDSSPPGSTPGTDEPPTHCPSGYRYVDAPFAAASVANTCVEQWQLALSGDAGLLDQAKGQLICPGAPQTPKPHETTSTDAPNNDAGNSSSAATDAMTLDPTLPDSAPSDAASSSESTAQTSSQTTSSDAEPNDPTTFGTGETTVTSFDASASTADTLSSVSNVSTPNDLDSSLGGSL